MANVLLPDKMSNQNQQNVFPVSALLGGAAIRGLLWYPYRLLEQAEVSGPVATMLTYAFALLLGLAAFRKNLAKSRILSGKPQLLLWIGLCAGWTNLAYVLGVIHGEIMRVMLLFYLAPLWTIVFPPPAQRSTQPARLSGYGFFTDGRDDYALAARNRFFDAFVLWRLDGVISRLHVCALQRIEPHGSGATIYS